MKRDTPPRKAAVALRYRAQEGSAPRVTAQGAGVLAERILAIAKEHHIPVYQDAALVETLAKLDLGAEIPEPLYRAVAKILAFVYALDQRRATHQR
jgi:flagellar biosynthesis protein